MSSNPAIITPLTAAEYMVRFNLNNASSEQIYLVQMLHSDIGVTRRMFVMIKIPLHDVWVVRYCNQVPNRSYGLEAPTQKYWFADDESNPFMSKMPFDLLLRYLINNQQELIKWI